MSMMQSQEHRQDLRCLLPDPCFCHSDCALSAGETAEHARFTQEPAAPSESD